MSLVLVQINLERCDTPASLALITKFTHVRQCRVRSDEHHSFTYGRASCHLDDFAVLAFTLTFFLLHGTAGLLLYHPFYVVVVLLQIGAAEVPVYPLLVTGGEFGNDIDSGLGNITHVLACPPVMRHAGSNIARLDMYA